jgi:hypothetical protein
MRKNPLARQVRTAYCENTLRRICTLREDRFGRAFGMQTVKIAQPASSWRRPSDRSEDYYHFRDNGGRVLAVAHLDTVVSQAGRVPRFSSTEKGPLIVSGALDDRLGAYVILDLLPKLGITCDWLFTVGEESGMSTAEFFKQEDKAYDHVIEFDRMGTDVVMYQYEDRASRRLVEAAGASMGQGSFSDIAYLEQLNVKCLNWGVGYRGNYHSEQGYAYLNDTFAMVAKYMQFHGQNAGVPMPHEERSYGYGSRSYDKYDTYDAYYLCGSCGEEAVDSVTWYCTDCGICADCGATNADIAAGWNDPDVDVCQCYTPKHATAGSSYASLTAERLAAQDEAAEAGSSDIRVNAVTTGRMTSTPGRLAGDLKGLTWEQYLAKRPGAWSDDNGKTWHSTDEDSDRSETCDDCGKDLVDECRCEQEAADELDGSEWCLTCEVAVINCTCGMMEAYRDAQEKDGPGPLVQPRSRRRRGSPSIAPRWSEHRVSESGTGWANGSLGAAAQRTLAPRYQGGDWHETIVRVNPELADIPGHIPGSQWALVCLRCAARWPHPIPGNSDRPEPRSRVITTPGGTHLHAERDCPGCERCIQWNADGGTGTIHVIPAHFPGTFAEDGTCAKCNAMEHVFTDDSQAGLIARETARETARRQAILDAVPTTEAASTDVTAGLIARETARRQAILDAVPTAEAASTDVTAGELSASDR